MISFENVHFAYARSRFSLSIPDFEVSAGSTVAIVGPSGSGKTTLLNLAAGILSPNMGRISSNGFSFSEQSDSARRSFRLRQIGLVFQEFELLEHLSVLDNILLPCRMTSEIKLDGSHRDRALELAESVGLTGLIDRYVRRLSQGERQRVAICRALLLSPSILLCDEPTGNLDPTNKQHVLDIILGYVQQMNATLMVVTHDHAMLDQFETVVDVGRFHGVKEIAP